MVKRVQIRIQRQVNLVQLINDTINGEIQGRLLCLWFERWGSKPNRDSPLYTKNARYQGQVQARLKTVEKGP